MSKQISIWLTDAAADRIREVSEETRQPESDIIVSAVEHWHALGGIAEEGALIGVGGGDRSSRRVIRLTPTMLLAAFLSLLGLVFAFGAAYGRTFLCR